LRGPKVGGGKGWGSNGEKEGPGEETKITKGGQGRGREGGSERNHSGCLVEKKWSSSMYKKRKKQTVSLSQKKFLWLGTEKCGGGHSFSEEGIKHRDRDKRT